MSQRVRHTLLGRCSKCGGPQVAIVVTESWKTPIPFDHEKHGLPNPCLGCYLEEQSKS